MKPNFSGTWRFNPVRSRLQISPPDATIFVLHHREPALHISRTHYSGEKKDTFSIDLTTDGREVVVDRGDLRLHSRAYWDDDTLVFETRFHRAGDEARNVVRYTLSPDGSEFTADEQFRSATLNHDNLWVMERS